MPIAANENSRKSSFLGYVSVPPFSNASVFISLRFRMILNHFHYSVFAKSAKRAPGTKTGVFPLLRFRSFSFLLFALVLKPRMLYKLLLERFRMTPFSVFPLKTVRFQMSPFSYHSTLNSVFKCLRFRSFSMETPTQKRRHSTPFSYENGVMETGPSSCFTISTFILHNKRLTIALRNRTYFHCAINHIPIAQFNRLLLHNRPHFYCAIEQILIAQQNRLPWHVKAHFRCAI